MSAFRLCVIDCDLYQSTKEALAFVAPLIQDGSIMLFDDWNSFGASDQRGERAAFHEFLTENPGWMAERFTDFGNHGRGFLMKKRLVPKDPPQVLPPGYQVPALHPGRTTHS